MAKGQESKAGDSLGPCPICGRERVMGPSVDYHHWLPRAYGGRLAQPVHLICHRKLHSLFSEKELATVYTTPEAVRRHPAMQTFIRWVRRRPPEFYYLNKKPRR